MLGPTAASNVGLPNGGDRYNPRYLRLGTSDEAGSGLTQAQGAVEPKRTEVRGNQECQVRGAYLKKPEGNSPAICCQSCHEAQWLLSGDGGSTDWSRTCLHFNPDCPCLAG